MDDREEERCPSCGAPVHYGIQMAGVHVTCTRKCNPGVIIRSIGLDQAGE